MFVCHDGSDSILLYVEELSNEDEVAENFENENHVICVEEDVKSDTEMQKSPYNSEDIDEYSEFFEERDMEKPELTLEMKFASANVFRAAVREYSILNGYDIKFLKNESSRVTVVCKEECGWRMYASLCQNTNTFQVKSVRSDHTCPRTFTNKQVTSGWLSKKYIDKLKDDPNWSINAMKKCVRKDWMVDVSVSQIHRAKRKALEVIEGNHREQYLRLWDYCEMIRRQNIGRTAKIQVERTSLNDAPIFQMLFIMFDAQTKGFLLGCRSIIDLDACHLKGPYGGQLMHEVARDGNNQMYPLAIAAVESECKSSWTWFLKNLIDVIGRPE